MVTITYDTPKTSISIMTTEMNSLATGQIKNNTVIASFDNTSNRDVYAVFELELGADLDLSAQTNSTVELYLIPSYDGTNFADDADETNDDLTGVYYVGAFSFTQQAGSRRAVIEGITLSPLKYKIAVKNSLGVTMNATGNVVRVETYSQETR